MSAGAPVSKIPVQTAFGNFYLQATSRGLYGLKFPARESKIHDCRITRILSGARKLLQEYFKGRPVSFRSLKIDLSGFTAFEQKVLKILSRIPRGRTHSYGWLAAKAGSPKAARAAGAAMRKNRLPIILPCHRIVPSGGGLGGYSQGLGWKKRLLALERNKV